jgi:hypothetical protein
MFNLYSVFNTALLNQVNSQTGNNIAIGSLFTQQTLVQAASNNANVVQGR